MKKFNLLVTIVMAIYHFSSTDVLAQENPQPSIASNRITLVDVPAQKCSLNGVLENSSSTTVISRDLRFTIQGKTRDTNYIIKVWRAEVKSNNDGTIKESSSANKTFNESFCTSWFPNLI